MEEQNQEQMQEQDKKQNVMCSVKELVEAELTQMLNVGIQPDNLDDVGKLVDIHKDIENEEYWKNKEEVYSMRY
ncbi:MAG: hypothetical protein K2J20_02060, partial [Bacilli bacterium]|nr:hypothetical protein [Bacilli bacterium]